MTDYASWVVNDYKPIDIDVMKHKVRTLIDQYKNKVEEERENKPLAKRKEELKKIKKEQSFGFFSSIASGYAELDQEDFEYLLDEYEFELDMYPQREDILESDRMIQGYRNLYHVLERLKEQEFKPKATQGLMRQIKRAIKFEKSRFIDISCVDEEGGSLLLLRERASKTGTIKCSKMSSSLVQSC